MKALEITVKIDIDLIKLVWDALPELDETEVEGLLDSGQVKVGEETGYCGWQVYRGEVVTITSTPTEGLRHEDDRIYNNAQSNSEPTDESHGLDEEDHEQAIRGRNSGLILYADYTRHNIHEIFAPGAPYLPGGRGDWGLPTVPVPPSPGQLIPTVDGDYVFFVTTEETRHSGISRKGIFNWESHSSQAFNNHEIQRFTNHDHLRNNIFLFFRIQNDARYTYLGNLKYLSHDPTRQKPVHIEWEILYWNPTQMIRRIGHSHPLLPLDLQSESEIEAATGNPESSTEISPTAERTELVTTASDNIHKPENILSKFRQLFRNLNLEAGIKRRSAGSAGIKTESVTKVRDVLNERTKIQESEPVNPVNPQGILGVKTKHTITESDAIPAYPKPTLPLVPKVLAGMPGLDSRIYQFMSEKSPMGNFTLLSDLDASAWEVLGKEACNRLAIVITKIVAEEMYPWATTDSGDVPLGLSIQELSSLPLSPRVKNSLRRSTVGPSRMLLERFELPTVGQIINFNQFGPVALLELFGTLECRFGPGLPISESTLDSPANRISIPLEVWSQRIDTLGMSRRTVACLRRDQIKYVGDLTSMCESDLLSVINFGSKSLIEVENALGRLNVGLRKDGDPQPVLEHNGEHIGASMHKDKLEGQLDSILENNSTTISAEAINKSTFISEARAPYVKSTPIMPAGGDPADAWSYIERHLKEREITVLRRRWLYGDTLERVAQLIGVLTRERIRQIEAKAERRLRENARLKSRGLDERLQWIESRLFEAVENRGGHTDISSVESDLGWPEQSIKTWIALNAVIGVLNPQQKAYSSNGEFGRLLFDGSNISSLGGLTNDSDGMSFKQRLRAIVGPTRIMLLEDLLNALERQEVGHGSSDSDPVERGRALEKAGVIDLLEATHQDELMAGRWVAVGLTFPAREIARAILYESKPSDNSSGGEETDNNHLRIGLRSDLISDWLFRNSEHKSNARAINAVCERNSSVFVRTGPTSWGLLGAGADAGIYDRVSNNEPSALAMVVDAVAEICKVKSSASKSDVVKWLSGTWSDGWIQQVIDKAVEKGYLINQQRGRPNFVLTVGKQLPAHEKFTRKKKIVREKGSHGETSRLVLAALKDQPGGLSDNDVLRCVREIQPNASANSVYVYLNHTYRDMIEKTPSGYYRLRGETTALIDETTEQNGLTTIGILIQVLENATEPLSIDEITMRCNQIKPVKRNAIQTHLSSNYGDRFTSDGQGKYSIEHPSSLTEPSAARTIQRDGPPGTASETVILNRNKPRPLWCNNCGKVSRHYFDRNDELRCENCGQIWSR